MQSEFSISWGSRETRHVSDVVDSGYHHHQPLKTETKATMRDRTVPPQIQVPPVVFFRQVELIDPLFQHFEPLLSGRSTHNLSNSRSQHVKCCHSFAILILTHVESFDVFGVVVQDNGFVENMVA